MLGRREEISRSRVRETRMLSRVCKIKALFISARRLSSTRTHHDTWHPIKHSISAALFVFRVCLAYSFPIIVLIHKHSNVSTMHPLVRDLYKRVLHVGHDYPLGLEYVRRTWKKGLRNVDNCPSCYSVYDGNNVPNLTSPNCEKELHKAVAKGRYMVREMIGIIQLKKYRAMKQRYDKPLEDLSVAMKRLEEKGWVTMHRILIRFWAASGCRYVRMREKGTPPTNSREGIPWNDPAVGTDFSIYACLAVSSDKLIASSRNVTILWRPRSGGGGKCPTCGVSAPEAFSDDHCTMRCRHRTETQQAIPESVADSTKLSEGECYVLPEGAEILDEPPIESSCQVLMGRQRYSKLNHKSHSDVFARDDALFVASRLDVDFAPLWRLREGRVLRGPSDDNCDTLESRSAEALRSPPTNSREGDTFFKWLCG